MAPPYQGDACRVCGKPRQKSGTVVLCEDCARAYYAERSRAHRAAHQEATAQYSRLRSYRAAALDAGATEDEAARISMAADLVYVAGLTRPRWLGRFVAQELDYLRRTADVRAKLDAWQPVAGFVNTEWTPPAVAWELEESA